MPHNQSAEVSALVAVLEEDYPEARAALEDFFPTELRTFLTQLETLTDLAKSVLSEKGAR